MRILGQYGRSGQSFIRLATLAVALVLAACTTPKVKVAPIIAPPVVVAPPKVEVAPTLPQNKVALLVPLTGPNAVVGQSIANSANLALLDVGDRRINLRIYDTASAGAEAAAAKAVADGARLFLGPLLAADVKAVQARASANNIPVIAFSNDAALAGEGTYIMGFQPGQAIARVVGFASSRGVQRFAALVPDGVYGQRATTAFLRAVEVNFGKTVAIKPFSRDPAKMLAAARAVTDYDARVSRASTAGALRPDGTIAPVGSRLPAVGFQALLIADSGAIASAFGRPLAQFGAGPANVTMLGTELWSNEPALKAVPSLQGALFAAVPDGRFDQLAVRYRAKFGGAPSRLASLGYDSVLLVNSLADKWPIGVPFPRRLLSGPDGFTGIDGVFRFGASGVAERALEVQQISAGRFVTVSPAPRSLRSVP